MDRMKTFALVAAMWLLPFAALAQTSPGWIFNYVPTTAEFNAAFAGKTDYTGSPAITSVGGTFSGKVNFAASSAGTAGLNCGVGTAPSSPVNGDLWCTTTAMFVRINGSTVQLGGGGTLTVPNGGTGQTTFTANLPLIGNGASAIAQGTRSGNTTVFGTVTGTTPNGACVSFDGAGNLQNAGVGACGGTGGSGTVSASTTNNLAVYTAAATVGGVATANNGVLVTSGAGIPSISSTLPAAVQGNITALGTIATGAWQSSTPVGALYGGTGVAQSSGSSTITLGGAFVTGDAVTLTTIGATNVTLPTSGNIMNQNGTSGGVPYYNSATTTLSSGALTANRPVFGGGAGASPFVGTRTGNTTDVVTYSGAAPTDTHCAQWDASGNLTNSSAICAGASGGSVLLTTLTASTSTALTDIGSSCPTASGTTGCFSATYSRFEIDIENLVITTVANQGNFGCQIQLYNSGGTYQTSGYIAQYNVNGTTDAGTTAFIPCWPVQLAKGANNMTAPGVNGSFIVYNPSAASKTMVVGRAGVNVGAASDNMLSSGYWNTNGVIVGFRVCPGSVAGTCAGTWASGTIKVYGLP